MSARDKILETAAQLFATQGYTDTSLAQVARAACVSKALVLWHFDSKERLFRATQQHFLAPYKIDDQALVGLGENEQVEKLINDYYDFIAEHLSSVKFVLGQVVGSDENSQELVSRVRQLYRVYHHLLANVLVRGRARRVFGAQVRPDEDAALIMATLNGLLMQRLVEGEQENPPHGQQLLARFKKTTQARLCLSHVSAAVEPQTPSHRNGGRGRGCRRKVE